MASIWQQRNRKKSPPAWLLVSCSECDAKRGQRCKALSGRILPDSDRARVTRPHRARVVRAGTHTNTKEQT